MAAAGELEKKGTEKKQAATVFTGEEENASGVGVARTRKWASDWPGPFSLLPNSQGQAGHFAAPC